MEKLITLRIIGSCLVIAAYFIILHLNVMVGIVTHILAMTISMPYFVRSKSWDVVIMFAFIISIGIGKLYSLSLAWKIEENLEHQLDVNPSSLSNESVFAKPFF